MIQEKSCGAIIISEDNQEIKVLLLKHNAGHWAFSKGHVEANETEEETALREIKEETNLDVELDTNFRTSVTYSPMENVIKEVVYFLAYKVSGEEHAQFEEISQLEWFSLEEAIEKLTFENDKDILEKVKHYLKKI